LGVDAGKIERSQLSGVTGIASSAFMGQRNDQYGLRTAGYVKSEIDDECVTQEDKLRAKRHE
jgi:hypothetical protein